jgi:DNA-binding GntR family transcriptional regulator
MDASPPGTAKDRAYAHVKERILDGGIAGGSLLSEGEVAEAVGVSRTPVREAFLLLEAEGLMRLYPKRGALVVAVSPDEVRDVMETRLLIEQHAARRVSEDGGTIAGLEESLATQAELVAAGDLAGFAAEDRHFHRAIVAAAGNGILTRLYDSLHDRQRRMNAASIAHRPELAERFLAEHRRIAAALRAHDAAAAQRAVEEHLGTARGGAEAAVL